MLDVLFPRRRVRRLAALGRLEDLGKLSVKARQRSVREEAVAALRVLGYECIHHEAVEHEEVTSYTYYCIGSDANSNCHNGCVNGDMCNKVPNGTHCVIDVPERFEIVKTTDAAR